MRSAFTEFIQENFSFLRDPSDALDEEIKIMLGRDEISQEQYDQLNRKLRYGSLGRGDLELLRRQARKRALSQSEQGQRIQEPAVLAEMDRLFVRISSLEDARRETKQALMRLESDLRRVAEYASSAEEMARTTLPDENEARALLEIRQNMLERLQALEGRKRSLEAGLRRVELLQGELYAREAELRAVEAQAGLARTEYGGVEGLLDLKKPLGQEEQWQEEQWQSDSEEDRWRNADE
jgi:hypothetical protein